MKKQTNMKNNIIKMKREIKEKENEMNVRI